MDEDAVKVGQSSSLESAPFDAAFVRLDEAHSEYDDSDELASLDGSSEDETVRRPRSKSFNEATDFKRPINLEVGLKFADHKPYRRALK